MAESLLVILYGDHIGTIERASRFSDATFTYDSGYRRSGSVPLSTRIPLSSRSYDGRFITPFLDGLLPENPAVRQRWADQLDADGDDAFALLARMGWDCPGAVQFCPPDEYAEMVARAGSLSPVSEGELAVRLRALRDSSASWTMPEEHWSLPGVQDKFALARRGGRWFEAHGSAPTTHILKPGIGSLHHQALVEHLTMRAVEQVGLDVARTELVEFDGESAIVIERFDRITLDDDTTIRLHQEDFCQAVGRSPSKKYEEHQGPTMADLVRVIDRHSTDQHADRRNLGDFAAINYLAGAPDGHSKNISLQLLPGQTRIAPLYDLATSFPYEGGKRYREVALSIGGRRTFGQVLAKNWDRAARTLGIPPQEYRDRVLSLARDLPDAMADAMAEAADTSGVPELRDRSLSRLAEHCQDTIGRIESTPVTPGPPGPVSRRQPRRTG